MPSSAVRGRRGRRAKGKATEQSLAAILDLGFKVIGFGYGPHWQLTKPEADKLAADVAACAGTISAKKLEAIERVAGKIVPWIALTVTAGIITYPRYLHTVALMHAAQGANNGRTDGEVVGTIRPNAPGGEGDGHTVAEGDADAPSGFGANRWRPANDGGDAGDGGGAGE